MLMTLAQAAAAPVQGGMNPLIMVGVMVVMFYFLLIRPQQRAKKEQQERSNSLQQGDRVITTSGVHALVHSVGEKTVKLKVSEGVVVEYDKLAVAHVFKKD